MKAVFLIIVLAYCLNAGAQQNTITLRGGPTYQGLVAWWKFNSSSGTKAYDSGINANHGTLSGSPLPVWTNGMSGNSLYFNNGGYVLVGTNASLNLTSAFTIAAWVNLPSVQAAYIGNNSPDSTGSIIFNCTQNTVMELQVRGVGSVADTSFIVIPTNWVHLAVTHSGTSYKFYMSGTNLSTVVSAIQPTEINKKWLIGYFGNFAAYTIGWIDDVRLYNRALTANEIKLLPSMK